MAQSTNPSRSLGASNSKKVMGKQQDPSRKGKNAQPVASIKEDASDDGQSGSEVDDEEVSDEEVEGESGEESGAGEDQDAGSDEDGSVTGDESKAEDEQSEQEEEDSTASTFAELGVSPELCSACTELGFSKPTGIQAKSIPHALEGKDVIGLAQTGSGKTVAFALPILQALWEHPQPFFALVLAPTRELAYQIHDQFNGLGRSIGLKTCVIVGGMEMTQQAIALSKRPHVIVATPGRLMDHLENTKGFSLRNLKYLVCLALAFRRTPSYRALVRSWTKPIDCSTWISGQFSTRSSR